MTELESLQSLRLQTNGYIQQIFDHVSNLGHTHLLGQLYDFQATIENRIKELENDQSAN